MDSRWAGPDSRGCSPLGIPSAQEGDDKAQTKPGLDATKPATVYVHGRKGRKMSAWLQWLAEEDPIHPSIHPISPTVYSQTDIDKSGKYGSPQVWAKAGQAVDSFVFVSAAALLKGQEAAAATALALTVFAVLGGGRC